MLNMLNGTSEKNCPYCGHKDTVKNFMTWEKDNLRGALGKTPEGFIMILCPKCRNHIKYDTLANSFLKKNQRVKSTFLFNLIFAGIIFLVLYFIIKIIF